MDELTYSKKQMQQVVKFLDEIKGISNAHFVLAIASILDNPLSDMQDKSEVLPEHV